jgi:hypothetical protein
VRDLHPDKTRFFAISTPSAPAPARKIFADAYLATASIPIAPIYLLHLSLTASSSILSSFFCLEEESI